MKYWTWCLKQSTAGLTFSYICIIRLHQHYFLSAINITIQNGTWDFPLCKFHSLLIQKFLSVTLADRKYGETILAPPSQFSCHYLAMIWSAGRRLSHELCPRTEIGDRKMIFIIGPTMYGSLITFTKIHFTLFMPDFCGKYLVCLFSVKKTKIYLDIFSTE